ncbi:dehydrogenase/reductase SDR family member FEY-like isoform X2 [Silene latifolia]|uniref:dehydrogenase/reductase SDR family member FEY-like isoform X2 n=1 Tax=Silene latifolia TaxID=37657 RepID=UPI003D772BDA
MKEEEKMKQTIKMKKNIGYIDWIKGWINIISEMLFQRIASKHLHNPIPLPSLHNLTFIVTGSTSGIGLQTARQLAESGAHVIMAVRNTKAAHELIQKWQTESPSKGLPLNIEVMEIDLLSLESVARFADLYNARSGPLHALINNAGICSIGVPQKFSKDGHEVHMQVNHLAPALLSVLLLPSLIRGSPSRIINVNSLAQSFGFVDPEDMSVVKGNRKYTSLVGYSSSKLAQVMFSGILQRILPEECGISVMCVSPGVVRTNVVRDLPKILQPAYALISYFFLSPQEGSRSSLFAATDPQVPEYCKSLKADECSTCAFISQDCRPSNPAKEAQNTETSRRVWEKTFELVGLPVVAVDNLVRGKEGTIV